MLDVAHIQVHGPPEMTVADVPRGLGAQTPTTGNQTAEIAQRWMEMVLGEKFAQGFPMALLSGVRLCRLVNKVFQALGMEEERRCEIQPTAWPCPQSAPEHGDDEVDDAWWKQQKEYARHNIDMYLSSCQEIGVAATDCFVTDDLLELLNMDRVYKNILALQDVAIYLSHRRSIDERSSADAPPKPKEPTPTQQTISDSVESIASIKTDDENWTKLLDTYEAQQLRKAAVDDLTDDPDASGGLGKLAHDIWVTEETIRVLLLGDDDAQCSFVPEALHGKLWLLASGAAIDMRRQPGQYAKLVEMQETSDATRQIDADLNRTIAASEMPQWDNEKKQALRRVLVAFSRYNCKIGYCQGLNYIAARLLQFVEEEEAFYLMIKIIALVPDDYYTTMLGIAVDQAVFADLVRLQMPDVFDHLKELGGSGLELSLACVEWFVTVFASPCDRDMTVRIWDAVFILGDELMFRVGLAMMQAERTKLIECKSHGDVLKQLTELGREGTDPIRVMRDAQNQDSVSRARIENFRAHHRLQIASGIAVSSVEADVNNGAAVKETESGNHTAEHPDERFIANGGRRRGGAGREYDTFDRVIADSASLEKEHPSRSMYYDGKAPEIMESYWGSKECFGAWGKRDYKRLEGVDQNEIKAERGRLQSLGVDSVVPQEAPCDDMQIVRNRDQRSKSSAFAGPRRMTTSEVPRAGDGGARQSPRGIFHRLDWNKDKRGQKERKPQKDKKVVKPRRSTRAGVDNSGSARTSVIYAGMQVYHPMQSASPLRRHASAREHESSRSGGFNSNGDSRRQNPSDDMLVNPSRSFSDPPVSPSVLISHSSCPDTSRLLDIDDIDAEIVMRSQRMHRSGSRSSAHDEPQPHSGRKSVDVRERRLDARGRESSHKRSQRAGNLPLRLGDPQLSSDEGTEEDDTSHRAFNLPLRLPSANTHSSSSRNASHFRAQNAGAPPPFSAGSHGHRDPNEEQEILHSLMVPPKIRRNAPMPMIMDPSYSAVVTYPRRVIARERQQVLSYMRKASDASSLFGGVPRTPGEPYDAQRDSIGSSESSDVWSAGQLPRRSSVSFLDKLSMGVEEDCLDDLNGLVEEVDRFPNANPNVAQWANAPRSSSSSFRRR